MVLQLENSDIQNAASFPPSLARKEIDMARKCPRSALRSHSAQLLDFLILVPLTPLPKHKMVHMNGFLSM